MPDGNASLAEFFSQDHRRCDGRWVEVEAAADAGDTENVKERWSEFEQAMRAHLRMEEEVLFPAFERATGMTQAGPTFVMRGEHEQMRGLLDQMSEAADAGECQELVDLGDTLLMLIQQHNQKEEHALYPMAQQALGADWPGLREKLLEP